MSWKSIPHRVVLRTFWKEDTKSVLDSVLSATAKKGLQMSTVRKRKISPFQSSLRKL